MSNFLINTSNSFFWTSEFLSLGNLQIDTCKKILIILQVGEREEINKLLEGIDFSVPAIDRAYDVQNGGWVADPDVLNTLGKPEREFTLSKGIIKIDAVIRPNAVSFAWDSDVRDVLIPGNAFNYVDFMDLVLEGLPMRIDTEMRSPGELRASFNTHSSVTLDIEGRKPVRYALGNPNESQQFQNDFVFREGITGVQVLGKERKDVSFFNYNLTLRKLRDQNPRMDLSIPFQRRGFDQRSISWPNVLDWVLTTHAKRRLIDDPRFDSLHLGGVVYDLLI